MKKRICYKAFKSRTLDIYNSFSQKEGAQHIATPVTIQALIDITNKVPTKHVLEIGAGIGTLTYTLLKHTDAYVDTYEDNIFCRNALSQNISDFSGRYTVLSDYSKKPPRNKYDLIIVDGGSGKHGDGGKMKVVEEVISYLEDVKIVYIEGGRHIQRALLRKALSGRFRYKLIEYKEVEIDGNFFKGGLAIYCTPESNALARSVNYFYWGILDWNSFKNAVMYRINHLKRLVKIKTF